MKRILAFWVVAVFMLASLPVSAEDNGEGSGFLKGLTDVLEGVAEEGLQEVMDDWLGTYDGRIGQVEVVERRGNALVLGVTYEKIKRADGVHVDGRVLDRGFPLEEFVTELHPVQGRSGRVRLTISKPQSDWGSGWDEPSDGVESDQVELFLVRRGYEDRPFGHKVYPLVKTWTDSDAPDEPPQPEAADEVIALADEEEAEPAQSSPFPGVVLKPVEKGDVRVPATRLPPPTSNPAVKVVSRYDFVNGAAQAQWRSGSPDGQIRSLSFPGGISDKQGYVRSLSNVKVNPDNLAGSVLQTHPRMKQDGFIAGSYPRMLLDESVRFKAMGAFIKGAEQSDGATFVVRVYDGNNPTTVLRKHVSQERPVTLDADLSPWAGKAVGIMLRVDAGETATHDWAVWVRPRLEKTASKTVVPQTPKTTPFRNR